MSTSLYPPTNLASLVLNQTGFKTVQELRENVLEVDIWLRSMEVKLIEETFTQTLYDLFSNIGGTVGLFLGASLFSFVEIFDLVVSVLSKISCPRGDAVEISAHFHRG